MENFPPRNLFEMPESKQARGVIGPYIPPRPADFQTTKATENDTGKSVVVHGQQPSPRLPQQHFQPTTTSGQMGENQANFPNSQGSWNDGMNQTMSMTMGNENSSGQTPAVLQQPGRQPTPYPPQQFVHSISTGQTGQHQQVNFASSQGHDGIIGNLSGTTVPVMQQLGQPLSTNSQQQVFTPPPFSGNPVEMHGLLKYVFDVCKYEIVVSFVSVFSFLLSFSVVLW